MKKVYAMRYLMLLVLVMFVVRLEIRYLLLSETSSIVSEESKNDPFTTYMELVDQIFMEVQCFPVVKESSENIYPVEYSDTWGGFTNLWRRAKPRRVRSDGNQQ